jgi:hypothetical protein
MQGLQLDIASLNLSHSIIKSPSFRLKQVFSKPLLLDSTPALHYMNSTSSSIDKRLINYHTFILFYSKMWLEGLPHQYIHLNCVKGWTCRRVRSLKFVPKK